MSQVRFIADLHFGHKNMAIKRGFKDEFEHDEHIIEKWNSVVHKKDTTYILGDVTMESTKWYFRLDALNGRKIVVLGNHDMRNHVQELLKYVDQVAGMIMYKNKDSEKIFLTHCPVHPMELGYRIKYNIHGHIHENTITRDVMKDSIFGRIPSSEYDPRYICVSCEHVDYTPKLLSEIIIK